MNWQEIFKAPHPWLDHKAPSNDVVLSSRVRLARNLVDIPFPARLDAAKRHAVVTQVRQAQSAAPVLKLASYIDLMETKKVERRFLMERHIISPEHALDESTLERGVLISPSQHVYIMVNEEDHLRIQAFEAGLALHTAHQRADRLDAELGERLSFAFDSEWGFCTRCPTNAGTGMRASCLLHLPALVMNGDIDRVLEGLAPLGVTARGYYGERSKALGDLIQLSNAVSLGHSERELIENLERVVQSLMHYERQSREALLEPRRRGATEDQLFRAWGILRNARLISYDETMSLLSQVRLGQHLGFKLPVQTATLNDLMLVTQPAHLQLLKGGTLRAEERDRARAAMIRQALGGSEDDAVDEIKPS